jgi:hypothetical protein
MSRYVDGQKMKDLATLLQKKMPGIGFALLVFDFKTPGVANYISNAQRDDMILALEEKVKVLKEKRDFPTPNSN